MMHCPSWDQRKHSASSSRTRFFFKGLEQIQAFGIAAQACRLHTQTARPAEKKRHAHGAPHEERKVKRGRLADSSRATVTAKNLRAHVRRAYPLARSGGVPV